MSRSRPAAAVLATTVACVAAADVTIVQFDAGGVAGGSVRVDGEVVDSFGQVVDGGDNDGASAAITSCGGLVDDWYFLTVEAWFTADITQIGSGAQLVMRSESLAAVVIDDPPAGEVLASINAGATLDAFSIGVDEPMDFVLEFTTEIPDGFGLTFEPGMSGTLYPGPQYHFFTGFGAGANIDDPLDYAFVEAIMTLTPVCPADLDGDGAVGVNDLLMILPVPYGPCPGCPEDVNGDGEISVVDMLEILSAWGECP